MAMCNCKCLRDRHRRVKEGFECIGHVVMSMWVIFSMVAFFAGFAQAWHFKILREWFIAFCIANFFPYLLKLLGNTLAFRKKYKRDWDFHENDNSPYLVTFAHYQELYEAKHVVVAEKKVVDEPKPVSLAWNHMIEPI